MKPNPILLSLLLITLGGCVSASPTAFDPNLSAARSQMTAQAANDEAQIYAVMATGTAQAPIIDITETAAGLIAVQTQGSINQTSTAILWTPTASQVPTITPSPTANVVMTGTFSAMQAIQTQTVLKVQRDEMTNKAKAVSWYALAVAFLLAGAAYAYVHIRRLSFVPAPMNEQGRSHPMLNVLDATFTDIERATNGTVGVNIKFLRQLPAITPERQDQVTARSQMVDMATRARLPKRLLDEQSGQLPATEERPLLIDYPLPEWSAWMQNWKPGRIALGVNEKGLLQADPENFAHFLFAGTTGSWKTRGGMRVVVTCALASGWQVIIAGKQLDYKVFEQHQNAHLIPFSLLRDPIRAIALLRGVYAEIERRDRMMSNSGFSLWSQTGRSQTLVVVDEFSNLADALEDVDPVRRKELWRWARMDTAEARKYGIHMAYALQDPTAQSIDLRIRRNTTPVMFRVKDAVSSRTLLNASGAEMLSARHFLASMVHLERGAAFAPTDEEILQFLHAHPTGTAEQPEWIEGVLAHQPNLPETKQDVIAGPAPDQQKPKTIAEFINSLDEKGMRIVELYQAGGYSQADIEEQVFGYTGGAAGRTVKRLIEQYRKIMDSPTTTTTTTENPGNLGLSAA